MNRLTAISLFAAGSLALLSVGCSDAPFSAPTDSTNPNETAFGAGKLLPSPADAEIIPDSYIVVYNDDAALTPKGFSKTTASLTAQYPDIKVTSTFELAFKGFAANIPEARLTTLLNDPRVRYIERDQVARVCSTSTAQSMDWGVNYVGGDSSNTVSNNNSGSVSGVKVYVLDTGIDPNQSDLNVITGINYGDIYQDSTHWEDANGHGTHVAGTIAALDNNSYMVGVAPGAPLYAVRVFNSRGSGSIQQVMKGIEWVKRHRAANSGPAVANMSMSSAASWTFDQSTKSLISSGVTVCVAAGNEAKLASLRSPARVTTALTVGGIASNGSWYTMSNYGSGVDLLAPAVSVVSTARGGGVATKTGTSMAAPHVAGAAVLYLAATGNSSKTPAQVATALLGNTVAWGSSLPTGTPNKVLRVDSY